MTMHNNLPARTGTTPLITMLAAARVQPNPAPPAPNSNINVTIVLLSGIVGRPILNKVGENVGRLKDLIVRINEAEGKSAETYPPLAGLVARVQRKEVFVPWSQVAELSDKGIRLSSSWISIESFTRRNGEILLVKDVLDKQLADVEGRRIIRVNDLGLALVGGVHSLVAVDISFQALLRRLGVPVNLTFSVPRRIPTLTELQQMPSREPRGLHVAAERETLLDWADVEYFASHAPMVRLKISHDKIAKLHPVEIARLVDELSYVQGAEIVAALDDEIAADTLEEMTAERQADIIEGLDEERAADILEEMEPDAAADVLADLDEEKAESLLEKMDDEEAEDVKELLGYEEDTAGGLMTNDFVTIPADLTVGQAFEYLRDLDEQPSMMYYLYVVERDTGKLMGIVTLRDLIMGRAGQPLVDLMNPEVLSVIPDDPADDAARLIAEYNLLALPVINTDDQIIGIISVDDAMHLVLPDEWQRRLPRVFS